MFLWPLAVFRADYRAIISANGLDAYFFVRFLRVMAITFLPIWLISWIVLLPLTSVNTSVPGFTGLNKFIYGNVAPDKSARYAGHLILAWLFTCACISFSYPSTCAHWNVLVWILYNIKREMQHFIVTRQQHLIERTHVKSVQARTILITGIPTRYLTQDALYKLFNSLPGGVQKIWINRFFFFSFIQIKVIHGHARNLKELPDVYDRRTTATNKLESAETTLLRTAAKLRLKAEKKAQKGSKKSDAATADVEASAAVANAELEVPESERPTHRLGMIPFFGEKVDTINWARNEIAECTKLLDEGRAKITEGEERGRSSPSVGEADNDDEVQLEGAALDANGNPRLQSDSRHTNMLNPVNVGRQAVGAVGDAAKGTVSGVTKGAEAIKGRVVGDKIPEGEYPPLNSAFVTFNKQVSAHLAVQVLTHHEPYRMGELIICLYIRDFDVHGPLTFHRQSLY